jgi:predicted kinase
MKKNKIILFVGNIGSGKTTCIRQLMQKHFKQFVVVSRDDLRYMIGGGRYKFDVKLESAIYSSELKIISNFMRLKQNIIVDEVGINRKMRKRYIRLAKKYNYDVIVMQMPLLDKEVCVMRRMIAPHDCPDKKIWETVWEKFNKQYQAPSLKEGIKKIIHA